MSSRSGGVAATDGEHADWWEARRRHGVTALQGADLPTMILGARRPTAPGSEQGYLRQVAAWSRLDMLLFMKSDYWRLDFDKSTQACQGTHYNWAAWPTRQCG